MVLNNRSVVLLMASMAMLVSACSSGDEPEGVAGVRVVATTTMLGDIARNIVGDGGIVEVLLPIGADPHDYEPSSFQVSVIYDADLVIANGLGLEEGLSDVLAGAADDEVNVVEVAVRVDPVSFDDREPCSTGARGICDPHVWLDPERAASIALIVGTELSLVDTSMDWQARAGLYAAEIRATDVTIDEMLASVPERDRILVTNHDSLGYFADRFGLEIIGSVIPGGSTLSEPSSADLAHLVDLIKETGVSAIFAEVAEPATLAEAIASEVDHPVRVIPLFIGSLGDPGSGADTLIRMLETNAMLIADGLS